MNWISNYVRPKINSLFSRREVPENLWTKCDECGVMLFHRELRDNLRVCTNCDHHMYITPRERFEALFDGGIFTEVDVPKPIEDPLRFRDQKRYPERLRAAQKASGEAEAMLVAEGEILRTPVVAAAQDYGFMAGSMGMYVGNAFIAAAERAVALQRPMIVFSAAGGARMQEGILSLMQMPRTTVAVEMLKEAGLPYVVVLTHATTGGVTASYAMLGDVHIAEPGALICFAGPRVIEQTIRETLPEGFQRAEYLLDHGMLDRVTPRGAQRTELATILRMLTGPGAGRPRRPAASRGGGRAGGRRRTRPRDRCRLRRGARPAERAPSQGDGPRARPGAPPPGAAGPSRARGAAGDPRGRHERQGLDPGDDPRGPGGGRARPATPIPRRTSPAFTSASASPARSSRRPS